MTQESTFAFLLGALSGTSRLFRQQLGTADRLSLAAARLQVQVRARRAKQRQQDELRPVKLLGKRVYYYDISAVRFLFDEVFLHEQYKFDAGTDTPSIIDCGANIGMSILYFKSLYPRARIVGFEPFPEAYAALEKNVRLNGLSDVVIHQQAVSDQSAQMQFYVPHKAGSMKMSLREERTASTPITVDVIRLVDSINSPVSLLKMDIEGAEVEVMEDLARAGKLSLVREVIVEYHHLAPRQHGRLSRLLRVFEEHCYIYEVFGTRGGRFGAQEDVMVRARRAEVEVPHSSGPIG